jgi:hypothetical protein
MSPFTGYPTQDKIHLKVAAKATGELLAAKGEEWAIEWRIPIGPLIATNAPLLARQLFDDVIDVSAGQPPPTESVAAILTPRLAYFAVAKGASSGNQYFTDIKVEWTLTDAKGKTIWVDTVDGRSSESIPDNPKGRGKAVKAALEDLLLKSQRAIASAPAVRQFAQHPPP